MKPSITSESAWYSPASAAWFHCSRVVMWKIGSAVSDHPGRDQLGQATGVDADLGEDLEVVLAQPGRVEPSPVTERDGGRDLGAGCLMPDQPPRRDLGVV